MTLCGSDRILYSRAAATLNLLPSYSTVNCNEGKGWRQPAHPWACQSFIGDSGCRSTHGARINQNVTKYIGRKHWSCGETGRRRGHPGDLLPCATSSEAESADDDTSAPQPPGGSEEESEPQSDEEQREGGGGGASADEESLDWRTFRARLVAQSQVAESGESAPAGLEMWQARKSSANLELLKLQNPQLAQEGLWAHATGTPEQGGLLLAAADMGIDRQLEERYWQTVVLVGQHGGGAASWGLVLNRPSGLTIRQILSDNGNRDLLLAPFQDSLVYIGGFVSDGRTLFMLHGYPLPGSQEVVPGIFFGGLEAASQAVRNGSLKASEFRFFVGRVEWNTPGKLHNEVARRHWYTAACSRGIILKHCIQLPTPLWREVLELMGGEYHEVARQAYGLSDDEA